MWLQVAVNERKDLLNNLVSRELDLELSEEIEWLSPIVVEKYHEYYDQGFIKRLGVKLNRRKLSDFWPRGGPHWDALGKTSNGRLLLVEAKAHIPEMISTSKAKSLKSINLIQNSLLEVKQYLGVSKDVDWSDMYYQYANRLAHLYLLRVVNDLPAELLFLCFINDYEKKGPTTNKQWLDAIENMKEYWGLSRRHHLSDHVHHIFLDVKKLRR